MASKVELRSYTAVLWRRKLILIVSIATTILVAVGVVSWMTPIYTASTTLRIATPTSGSLSYVTYDVQLADRLANTYKQWILSTAAQTELISKLGLTSPPKYDATIPTNTEFLQITVSAPDPGLAADAANTLGLILISHVQSQATEDYHSVEMTIQDQLTKAESDLSQARTAYDQIAATPGADPSSIAAAQSAVSAKEAAYDAILTQYDQTSIGATVRAGSVSVASPATPPLSPSQPRTMLTIVIGLLVGIVGGVGLAFLFENLDSTFHSSKQIEETTGVPVIGRVPTGRKRRGRFTFGRDPRQVDAYSRLRARILNRDDWPRTLAVTSAEPKEGKTSVALELGAAIARAEHKVIVVDCDLRRPAIADCLGLSNDVGLTSILTSRMPLEDAIQPTDIPGLSVLTSGPNELDPSHLLSSWRINTAIQTLKDRFTFVVLDTPALLSFADAADIASRVDAVLLVVARGRTHREVVFAALHELRDVGASLLGIVVNRAEKGVDYRQYRRNNRRIPYQSVTPAKSDSLGIDAGWMIGIRNSALPLAMLITMTNNGHSPVRRKTL